MPDMISTGIPVGVNTEVKIDTLNKSEKIPSNIKVYDKKGQILGKDDFLKLFVTQLSKQDPLNPVNDREFIAQMAQFSSLEQMNNVANNMNELKSIQANTLIGKTLTGKDAMNGNIVTGEITRIIYDNSGNIFLRTRDNTVQMKDVLSLEEVKKEIVSRETKPVEINTENETVSIDNKVKFENFAIGTSILGRIASSEYEKNTNQFIEKGELVK